MRTKSICLVFLGVLILGHGTDRVSAAGLMNVEDSWLISSSITHQLLTGIELGAMRGNEFLFSIAQGRLYAMDELNQRSLTLEGAFRPGGRKLNLEGTWQQTGEGLFVESLLAAKLLLGNHPALGVSIRQIQQTLGGVEQEPLQNLYINLQAPFRWNDVHGQLQWQWPVYASSSIEGNSDFGRRNEIIKATIVHSQNAFAVVVDRNANGKPNFGFQMLMTLDFGVGFEFRVDSPTGSLGPGITIMRKGVMLRTSHVVHPHLGVTHRVALILGRFGGVGVHE